MTGEPPSGVPEAMAHLVEQWNQQWNRSGDTTPEPGALELYASVTAFEIEPPVAPVARLEDYRKFDIGTPLRCYKCGARDGVHRIGGDGGFVYACPTCPHPAE